MNGGSREWKKQRLTILSSYSFEPFQSVVTFFILWFIRKSLSDIQFICANLSACGHSIFLLGFSCRVVTSGFQGAVHFARASQRGLLVCVPGKWDAHFITLKPRPKDRHFADIVYLSPLYNFWYKNHIWNNSRWGGSKLSISDKKPDGKIPQGLCLALQWRHNDHDGVPNHQPSPRLFTLPFIQTQIKDPRPWLLFGEFTGDRWIPRTKGP